MEISIKLTGKKAAIASLLEEVYEKPIEEIILQKIEELYASSPRGAYHTRSLSDAR